MALESALVCHLAHAFVMALGVTSHQNAIKAISRHVVPGIHANLTTLHTFRESMPYPSKSAKLHEHVRDLANTLVVCHPAHAFVVTLGVTSAPKRHPSNTMSRSSGLAGALVVALGVMSRQSSI